MKQHLFAAITELNGECEYTTSILVCCDKDADLNELADTGDFRKITRRINGGFNGLADRLALWDDAKRVLNASYAGG